MLSSGTQAHYIFPSPPGCTLILMVQDRASNIMIIVQESGTKKKKKKREDEVSEGKHQLIFT